MILQRKRDQLLDLLRKSGVNLEYGLCLTLNLEASFPCDGEHYGSPLHEGMDGLLDMDFRRMCIYCAPTVTRVLSRVNLSKYRCRRSLSR